MIGGSGGIFASDVIYCLEDVDGRLHVGPDPDYGEWLVVTGDDSTFADDAVGMVDGMIDPDVARWDNDPFGTPIAEWFAGNMVIHRDIHTRQPIARSAAARRYLGIA